MVTLARGTSVSLILAQGNTIRTNGEGLAVISPNQQKNLVLGSVIGPFSSDQNVLLTANSDGFTYDVMPLAGAASTSIINTIRAAYDSASVRNPFVLGVMTTAPVVTNPAGSPLSTAYPYATGTNSRYFNVNGATSAAPQFIDTSLGNYLRMKGARTGVSTYNGGPVWSISWTAICSSLDISVLASSLPYRLQVDGAWVTAAGVTTGSNATINYNFAAAGGNKKRVFTLEMSQDQGFLEVRLGNNDTLYANPAPIPVVLMMGDSYTDGTLSPSGMSGSSFAGAFRAMMGCNVIAQGLGGTGYVIPGSSLALTSGIRLDDASSVQPNAVLIAMGTNDISQNSAAVIAAVSTVLRGVRSRLPGVPIVVLGPWGQSLNLSAALLQTESDIQAGFTAVADNLMRFIPMNRASALTTPWTTGTGNTGAVSGSGNSSVMIGPDGVHPSAAIGGIYYGQRAALEFVEALRQMAS